MVYCLKLVSAQLTHRLSPCPYQNCALFTGSPRDLIINTDLKTLASRLKEIPDCWLHCKLFSHRRLLKAHRLIAENEALGRLVNLCNIVSLLVIVLSY
jgi:hypothetical protein